MLAGWTIFALVAVLQREAEQGHRLTAGPSLGRAVVLPRDVQNLDRVVSGIPFYEQYPKS